jgi:hypothetical protein
MIRQPQTASNSMRVIQPALFCAALLGVPQQAGASTVPPTFSRDVAPIIWQHCSACHRPGEAAPFPLTNYEEVQKRARLIRDVTEDHTMPPWHAKPGSGEFRNARILSAEEIRTFADWVEAGAPEGDPAETPPFPDFPDGWQLGEPDLVLTMDAPFEVRADGRDIYRYFVLPLALPEDKWVTAIEVRPSARDVVHHILFILDNRGEARKLDARDQEAGFRGRGFESTGELGGWAVGTAPQHLPNDLAMHLPKESDVILQTHFHPSGKVEQEKTTLGLHFADKAPDKTLAGFQVPPDFGAFAGIDIPPGKADFVIEDSWVLPVDMDLISVWGHAHQTCVSFLGTASLPDGGTIPLLEIPAWDFNWQTIYQYAEPQRLPAGTRINVRIVYDNSENNPSNPNNPPKRIRWGEQTTDEMGSLIFQAVPAQEEDLPRFAEAEQEQKQRARLTAFVRFIGREKFSAALQSVEAADADADGKVARDELNEDWKDIAFGILDRDESGFIEAEEVRRGREFAERLFESNE